MSKRKTKLNEKQEIFCQLYAGYGDRSCMANGTISYLNAYGIDTSTSKMQQRDKDGRSYWDYTSEYKSSKTLAHRLLTNVDIKSRVFELFQMLFKPDTVDNELLHVILQMDDLKAKVAAIREYNELKGRITKKIKLSGELKTKLGPDRVAQIAAQVLKAAKKK